MSSFDLHTDNKRLHAEGARPFHRIRLRFEPTGIKYRYLFGFQTSDFEANAVARGLTPEAHQASLKAYPTAPLHPHQAIEGE